MNKSLIDAARQGDLESIKTAISNGAAIDATDFEEFTPLIITSSAGHLECVLWLIRHGADVNAKNMHKGTALMAAAGEGHVAIVNALLTSGANLDDRMDNSYTALMFAVLYRKHDVIQLIKDYKQSKHELAILGRLCEIETADHGIAF